MTDLVLVKQLRHMWEAKWNPKKARYVARCKRRGCHAKKRGSATPLCRQKIVRAR